MHDDRENSEQPESEISKVCNPKDDEAGFLPCRGVDDRFCKRAPQCNCSVAHGVAATALPPTSCLSTFEGHSDNFKRCIFNGLGEKGTMFGPHLALTNLVSLAFKSPLAWAQSRLAYGQDAM